MKLSIIIPAYNEAKTLKRVIETVRAVDPGIALEKEIIVVNDGSADATREIIDQMSGITAIHLEKNLGKGAAIKKGFERSTGDFVIIQDSDLEYDPHDYGALLRPVIEHGADVVFGTRFRGEYHRVLYFWHYMGNVFLTLLSNMFTNLNLSDMEVGYKVFSKSVVQTITPKLKSKRFGIEPELTARVAHGGWAIYEVPIHYAGRTYAEGKKIGWRDGIKAIFSIIYFNIFDR